MANSFLPLTEEVLGSKIPEFVETIVRTKIQDQIKANAEAVEKHLWARLKEAKTREKLIVEIENIMLSNNINEDNVWKPKLKEPNYSPSVGDEVIPIIYLNDETLLEKSFRIKRYGVSHEAFDIDNGKYDEEFYKNSLISPEFFEGLCGLVETVKNIRMRKDIEHKFETFESLLKHERRSKLKSLVTRILGNTIWRKGLNSQQIELLDEIEAVSGPFRESLQLSLLSVNTDKSLIPSQYSEGGEVVFIEKGFEHDSRYRVIGKGNLNRTKYKNWQLLLEDKRVKFLSFQIKLFDLKTVSELEKELRNSAKRCHKQLVTALSVRLLILRRILEA